MENQKQNNEKFWVKVNVAQGDMDETISDLKELVKFIRIEHANDTQEDFAKAIGFKEESYGVYEDLEGKPYVGLSMIKKICQAYGLNCELTISYNYEDKK